MVVFLSVEYRSTVSPPVHRFPFPDAYFSVMAPFDTSWPRFNTSHVEFAILSDTSKINCHEPPIDEC